MNIVRRLSILAPCATLITACSSQGAIPNSPNSAPAAETPAVRDVVATVPAWRELGAKDAGRAPGDTSLAIVVTLHYRNQGRLDALVAAQAKPGSSDYRKWLTNEAFDREFAPAAQTYARVVQSLHAAGFHIDATYPNRTVVDASATVTSIERYFGTTIHRVVQPHQGTAFVNIRPAYAPRELSQTILGVDGLDTIVAAHAFHEQLAAGATRLQRPSTTNAGLFGPVSTVTGARGYSPAAFSAGYDMPIVHSAASTVYDGTGRSSGIIIDADFAESDLRQYLAYFHIKRHGPDTKRVLVKGGPPPGDGSADSVESALDAETVVGNAPGTALSMYEIKSLKNALIVDAFNQVVSDNTVDTANESFGGCEVYIGAKTVQALNAIAEQGAAKGITFHASTGDSGGLLCANSPASSPYVVAIGGTALVVGSGGAWAGEGAWAGSGGGISTIFAQPSWQSTVAGAVNRGRNVPDLAFDADPATGTAFFFTGSWNTQYDPLGGTSLASPIYGALVTEIDQVKNGRMGLGAAAVYGFYAANGYSSGPTSYFHDIVDGGNGAFYAGPGYDLVTGIGSVDAWNVAQKL